MIFKKKAYISGNWFKRTPVITLKITVCEYYNCPHKNIRYGGYDDESFVCNTCRKLRHHILHNLKGIREKDKYFYLPCY